MGNGFTRPLAVFVFLLQCFIVSPVSADRATVVGKPVRILVSESAFGGCMVQLSSDPQSQLPNCGSSWVTLSCDGTYMPKDVSNRLLEQAQMAFALEKGLSVHVDDARRHNGYCLAYRIDIW
jgi:hypothetical protein